MANGDTQNPLQVQTTPGVTGPRHGVSAALTALGGSFLASGVSDYFDDPSLGEAVKGVTDLTINMINDRFWKQEHEMFQKTYGQQYSNTTQQLWNEFEATDGMLRTGKHPQTGEVIEPWGPEAVQIRSTLMQDLTRKTSEVDLQLFQQAGKFGNNPYIGNMVNGILQQRQQSFKDMMGAYPQATSDAQSQIKYREAVASVSEEGSGLLTPGESASREKGKAELELTKAQTAAARASAASRAGEEFSFPPKGVPLQELDRWLMSPVGRKYLDPYLSSATNMKREQLLESGLDPMINEAEFNAKLGSMGPEINRAAIGMILRENLTDEQKAELEGNPRYQGYLASAPQLEMSDIDAEIAAIPELQLPPVRTRVTMRLSTSQIRDSVEGKFDEEGQLVNKGWGHVALADLTKLVATGNYKTIDAAIAAYEAKILSKDINFLVKDFQGSEKMRVQVRSRIRDYLIQNWKNSPYLKELFPQKDRISKRELPEMEQTRIMAKKSAGFLSGREDIKEKSPGLLGKKGPTSKKKVAYNRETPSRAKIQGQYRPAPEVKESYKDWPVEDPEATIKEIIALFDSGDPVQRDHGKLLLDRMASNGQLQETQEGKIGG